MLTITIPSSEFYNEETGEFIAVKSQALNLEHSLLSVSKWEAKWHKPFISSEDKTTEELLDYIKCMTITSNIDPNVYLALSADNIEEINTYILDPNTATWFRETNTQRSREIITNEIIYYQMIAYGIPFECQKWHLNRLLTLIRVCSIKNAQPKKMSKREIMAQNRSLNKARQAKYNTKG
jgi:hypothetical protein